MDKEKTKQMMQQFLSLDPILTTKLDGKLKPYAKLIYYVLMICVFFSLIGAVVAAFNGAFTIFLLELLLIAVSGIVVRMFCEYLSKE